jgi:hypothetical protein
VTLNAPDLTIDDVTSFGQLVAGEYTHPSDGEPYWTPNCREAWGAIQRAVNSVLRKQTCLQSQTRQELTAEVSGRLALCRNPSFFRSKNRAGWVYKFALLVSKNWIRSRIRTANRDERIRERLTSVVPAETSAEHQARAQTEHDALTFDRWQFGGSRGSTPDGMTCVSDYSEARTVEHGIHGDAELVAAIRDEVRRLPPDDQEFFWNYLDSRYQPGGQPPAARKRFGRLCQKVRNSLSQTPSP